MPRYDPFDPRRQGTAAPNQSLAQNQGGVPAQPAPPRAPAVPPVAVARNKKDSIVRPVSAAPQVPGATPPAPAPAAPGQLSVPPPPPPPTAGGAPMTGLEAAQPQGLEQQQPVTAEAQPQQPAQPAQPQEGETPEQATERAAQEQADAQPSQVKDYNVGAYNRVASTVKADQMTKVGQKIFNRQLASFGKTPFQNDPNAPAFPFKAGSQNFNPFTGSWSGTGRADFLDILGGKK